MPMSVTVLVVLWRHRPRASSRALPFPCILCPPLLMPWLCRNHWLHRRASPPHHPLRLSLTWLGRLLALLGRPLRSMIWCPTLLPRYQTLSMSPRTSAHRSLLLRACMTVLSRSALSSPLPMLPSLTPIPFPLLLMPSSWVRPSPSF